MKNIYWSLFRGFLAVIFVNSRAAPEFARSGCFFCPQMLEVLYCKKKRSENTDRPGYYKEGVIRAARARQRLQVQLLAQGKLSANLGRKKVRRWALGVGSSE